MYVIGAGSLGTLFAAYLARGGIEVSVVVKPGQLAAIGNRGLTVQIATSKKSFQVVNVLFYDDLAACKGSDVILIAVKAFDVKPVLDELRSKVKIDPSRQALCLVQNGIGIEDLARSAFPSIPLLRVSTTNGALLVRPAVVSHTGVGETFVGFWDEQRPLSGEKLLDNMVAALKASGLPVEKHGRMHQKVFEKCIVNAGINAVGAMFKVPNGKILELPQLREISRHLTSEAVAVARATGSITTFDGHAAVQAVLERTAANRNSMLQDVEKGRKTEIDFINDAFASRGKALGIDVSWNEFIIAAIHGFESLR
jgi:2-dehydropantoate 2-reductase